MKAVLKKTGIFLLILVLLAILVVGGYVLYIVFQYSRIPDKTALEVHNPQAQKLVMGEEITALTYNIGFGAYNPDFSFFMDSGVMRDGTKVTGAHARAQSLDIVKDNTLGTIDIIKENQPNFILLQEVDQKADRSWHLDQSLAITSTLPSYSSVYASNFHSAFLAYPFHEPHGAVEAGLLTLSQYEVTEAIRRSYPVDTSFPTKFFDLDRCFTLLRVAVEGNRELVLINTHMSAYDKGGTIRAAQLDMLCEVLRTEREKGNWVIVGGDFNHALCGTVEAYPSQQQVPEWVFQFDDTDLPAGFSVVCADNISSVATCRSSDMPYQPGVNYTTVLDGFIVSDNITATAENIDTGFLYSDHNPVLLRFTLE